MARKMRVESAKITMVYLNGWIPLADAAAVVVVDICLLANTYAVCVRVASSLRIARWRRPDETLSRRT